MNSLLQNAVVPMQLGLVDYYHLCRTHLSLEKDAPELRRVESLAMGSSLGGPWLRPNSRQDKGIKES